jgi:diadenosine tetraphosphate (Ap4A) HIT family hydrolase
MTSTAGGCVLCDGDGGQLLWRDAKLRVIAPEEADHPGFLRVVWNAHVAEMTDLEPADRDYLMHVVFTVEAVLRAFLRPHKVNLASFGNVVPHLHWHVIPRFREDPHFPNPVWGSRLREGIVPVPPEFRARVVKALRAKLAPAQGFSAP